MRAWHTGTLTRAEAWHLLDHAYFHLLEDDTAGIGILGGTRQWKELTGEELANWEARQEIAQRMSELPSPGHVKELERTREQGKEIEREHDEVLAATEGGGE